MATNDFLAFAGAGGANVLTQAQWAALAQLTTGFTSGILPGPNLNKALRQSSIISSMIGAFIAQQSGQNAVDDGTTATLLANFITAVNATGRIQLSGNTTWYVNGSTGSDTTGTGTSGAPWATIQKAVNTVQALYDGNGYVGTVQVADGSYAPFYISGAFVGFPFGLFNVVGDVTTPANCVISNSANGTSCVLLSHFAAINIGGFKLVNTGSATATAGAHSIGLFQGGFCGFAGKMEFGVAAGGSHIYAIDSGSTIVFGGATYTISGGAQAHAYAGPMARIVIAANGSTLSAITLSGTPAFSQGFIVANSGSFGGGSSGITFSGTGATGQRYQAINNGVIDTILSSTTFFPGSLAGTAGTGGLYI